MARQDLTGKTFHRLTVLAYDCTKKGAAYWLCQCSCPAKTILSVRGNSLKDDNTKSCGCQKTEAAFKHGHNRSATIGAPTPTYNSWNGMLARCMNPQDSHYPTYGALGVTVCERWYDFRNFLADMGERPHGCTLDRFPDPYGNYEPSNCRWATPRQQANNRRNTRTLTLDGLIKPLSMWAEERGVPFSVYADRKRLGWDDTRILTTPYTPRMPK